MDETQAEPQAKKSAARANKTMIGAYIPKDAGFALQELLLRISRERGERVTMQEAITESLSDFCRKHGVDLSFN